MYLTPSSIPKGQSVKQGPIIMSTETDMKKSNLAATATSEGILSIFNCNPLHCSAPTSRLRCIHPGIIFVSVSQSIQKTGRICPPIGRIGTFYEAEVTRVRQGIKLVGKMPGENDANLRFQCYASLQSVTWHGQCNLTHALRITGFREKLFHDTYWASDCPHRRLNSSDIWAVIYSYNGLSAIRWFDQALETEICHDVDFVNGDTCSPFYYNID